MPKDCPIGRKGSHDCWECAWKNKGYDNMTCKCGHPNYPADKPPKPHLLELNDREIKMILKAMDYYYVNLPLFSPQEPEFLELFVKIENLIK